MMFFIGQTAKYAHSSSTAYAFRPCQMGFFKENSHRFTNYLTLSPPLPLHRLFVSTQKQYSSGNNCINHIFLVNLQAETSNDTTMNYHFETIMQVRDYECDIQGIVNNANYMHYAEHTRHLFLRKYGVSFPAMHEQGEDPVVARVTMQYKTPLTPEVEFRSCLKVKREGIRYVFHQDFYRLTDNKLCFRAQFEIVFLVNGRLANSPTCDKAFAELFQQAVEE